MADVLMCRLQGIECSRSYSGFPLGLRLVDFWCPHLSTASHARAQAQDPIRTPRRRRIKPAPRRSQRRCQSRARPRARQRRFLSTGSKPLAVSPAPQWPSFLFVFFGKGSPLKSTNQGRSLQPLACLGRELWACSLTCRPLPAMPVIPRAHTIYYMIGCPTEIILS